MCLDWVSLCFVFLLFDNYKEYKVKGKRQGYKSRTNFSFEKMKEQLNDILTNSIPDLPKHVELQLPKLKKVELPKLKLPKLKKVETNG